MNSFLLFRIKAIMSFCLVAVELLKASYTYCNYLDGIIFFSVVGFIVRGDFARLEE